MKQLAVFLFVLFPLFLFSQATDSFSDGDFTSNPSWHGNTTMFEVIDPPVSGDGSIDAAANNDHLVLRSIPGMGDAVLVTTNNQAYGEWRFSIADGRNWSVSSTNDFKIILISDDSTITNLTDGTHNFNGYYFQFDGGNLDNYTLYRQSGTVSTVILDTGFPAGDDGTTPVGRTVKITRSPAGDWSIFIDDGFGISPSTQRGTTVTDNTHASSSWFGIVTNIANPGAARVLYFDDLYIGPVVTDTIKPFVNSVDAISPGQLDIMFSESLDSITAETTTNYLVNNSIGYPDSAVSDPSDMKLVHLYFSNPFISGQQYIVYIQDIEDLSGNIMEPDSASFSFYVVLYGDIVINEIMADPTPAVNLPEYEFIELFNRSSYQIDAGNWTLTVGTTVKTIPDFSIAPGEFIILCSDAAAGSFQTYGDIAEISSMQALTNGGATITIKDNRDTIISTVTYSDQWYQDPSKTDGGWTLERIDPDNDCGTLTNWKASTNSNGGTPGSVNSIYDVNVDSVAPSIIAVYAVSSAQLTIRFSESVNPACLIPSNFPVNQSIGEPTFIDQDATDDLVYHLYYMNDFSIGVLHTLNAMNLTDDCNNILASQQVTFIYYEPSQFDVLINEIMADPAPSVGLPEAEYLELYNRTGFDINLTGWILHIGSKAITFPASGIDAGSYLIITSDDGYIDLTAYGSAVDMTASTDLTNAGTTVSLENQFGNIIHTVTYSDSWYQDAYKSEGGWSLEMIDPGNPCEGMENWKVSGDYRGGTPGEENSVNAANPDNIQPELVRAYIYPDDSLKVWFSEPLDSLTLINTAMYTVDNGVGQPVTIYPIAPEYSSVILEFSQPFQHGVIYTLNVTDSIKDCSGNYIVSGSTCQFALPDSIASGDILINEVLFNPAGSGVDYVEIYNHSSKVLDLSNLLVGTRDDETWLPDNLYQVSSDGFLVFPEGYILISEDKNIVLSQFSTENENGFVDIGDLTSYTDAEGLVLLTDKWENLIDEFHYTADMQFELLNDVEGVSLERINFNLPTNETTNWHSAAENVGFGTPGYKNSQYSDMVSDGGELTVNPEIFSPDNDGYNDVLTLTYKFDQPGYVGNLIILDAKGRIAKKLVNNELLGTSGSFLWDGLTDSRTKARIGIYLLYFEVFDLEGNMKKFKKTCVVASKLN
ncbi:MAG: lamin tail domain-containing protein [Bacteroidota bacterium]